MKGRKKQQGFNLIELMIVVGIIGLLASVAGGMYSDYMIRLQVAEGFVLSAAVRTEMQEYHNENGQWPNNNNMASLQNQNALGGQFTKMIGLNQHRVQIQYGEDANAAIWGKKIELVPTVENGVFNWSCEVSGGGVDEKYLPEFCRGSTTGSQDLGGGSGSDGSDGGKGGKKK
jgi:type IV pilus assembly protein PilA